MHKRNFLSSLSRFVCISGGLFSLKELITISIKEL